MSNQNENGKIIPIHNPNYADDGNFVNTGLEEMYPNILGNTMAAQSSEHVAFIANNQKIIEARERSIADKRARDMRKKKLFKERVQSALVAFALVAMMGGGYMLINNITKEAPVVISEEDKRQIDDRISFYYEKADFIISKNISTNSVKQYSEKKGAITDYLLDAASVSDLEFRCALLGTAKSLGGSRFNSTLNNLLNNVQSEKDKYKSYSPLLFSGSTDQLLDKLGYKNFVEYWKNERESIYQLFLDKGLSSSEAEVATMLATGNIDYEYFDTNSNGRGGK